MKKWICFTLMAALMLVSCHKTIISEDVGYDICMVYTNDLKVDCVISWKDPIHLEEEASIRELLPGKAYIQHLNTNAHDPWDEKGECRLLRGGKDLRFTFGDGTSFSLDQADDDFWKTLPRYSQTIQKREDGTIREQKIEILLSDIHVLAIKP